MTEQNQGQNEFAAVLMQHAKGTAHDKATKLLSEAVDAVRQTGKNASVTVTLKLSAVKNNPNVVAIEDTVTAKVPEEKRGSMWFSDDSGGLHRNDPNQESLFDAPPPAQAPASAAHNPDQFIEPRRGDDQ